MNESAVFPQYTFIDTDSIEMPFAVVHGSSWPNVYHVSDAGDTALPCPHDVADFWGKIVRRYVRIKTMWHRPFGMFTSGVGPRSRVLDGFYRAMLC